MHDADADPLGTVLELLKQAPHSAPALTLYALINTLGFPRTGCLFKLDKLKVLNPEQRQLAYQLIEMMVHDENQQKAWLAAKQQMDNIIRQG